MKYDRSIREFKPIRYFQGPRLLIRRIISRQRRIVATYVEHDFLVNKSYLPVLARRKEYSLLYILALINSRLFSWQFFSSSEIARRDDFPQLDIETVRSFPYRRIHFTTRAKSKKKLFDRLKTEYGRCDEGGVLAMVEACLPKDEEGELLAFRLGACGAEEKSDVIHDFLASLAERMIALQKERREKADEFTSWLKEIKGIDTNSLKSVLKELWNRDEKGLAKTLKAKKMHPSPSDWDEIKHEFSRCHDQLVSISTSIDATDHLIDQIVYRLYGLTPDQIKLVEERRD